MKKQYVILIFSLFFISCLNDPDTERKDALFSFYENMKTELKKENIKWFEKHSDIKDLKNIDGILFKSDNSLKNFVLENYDAEYSVTISYNIGYADSYHGSIIVRNSLYEPVYYYIKLAYEKGNWKIISIDKLPLEN